MANDYGALFDAIDIQLNAGLRKIGFTGTLVGRVVATLNAAYGEYLVSYQTSQFSATARDNIAYNTNDLVYVAYTNGDSNLGYQIIGKVSTRVQEKVDLLASALERYTSLGDFSLEPEDATTLIFVPEKIQIEENDYGPKVEEVYEKREDGSYPLALLDPTSEAFDSFKRNLIISPKILCNLYVQPQTISQEYINDYGVEFTLEFNAGNQVEDALDQVDANGHNFATYERTYTFNINKMIGQPLSYITDGFMHQYAIFNVEKPENLKRVVKIRYYAEFNKKPSNGYKQVPLVTFGACTICAAIDKVVDVNSYYSVSLNSADNVSVISNDQTLQLSAQFRFKDDMCNPNGLEYYWFVEDLTVRAKDKEKFNLYGGEGWRCLNAKENIEKDNNGLFTVEDWVPGSSTLVVDSKIANLYENRFKCCVYYNNGIIVSPIFTVINLTQQNKLRVKLTSKVRSYKWKREIDNDPALYDDSNLNRYVNSLNIGLTDTAVIVASLLNTQDNFDLSTVKYVWQKVDSLDQSSWFTPNGKDDSFTYLYGSEVIKNMTIKCGIWINEQYYGAASVTLESIDDDLRARLISRENLFNTITNNGKYKGIYYIVPKRDEHGEIINYTEISAEDINNQNPEDIDLYINASRLQVGDNNNIKFLADIYKTDVQIAGFTVTQKAIYNGKKSEVNIRENGAYFGTDGLAIGDNNSYIEVSKSGVDSPWKLEITGKIIANEGNIGGFEISGNSLITEKFGINPDVGIWLGSNDFNNANFSVSKEGKLTVKSNADITGTITAEKGKIGGFDINGNVLSTTDFGISSDDGIWLGGANKDNANFSVSKEGKLVVKDDADIKGHIIADTGQVGGFQIDDGVLYAILNDYYVRLDANPKYYYAIWVGLKKKSD